MAEKKPAAKKARTSNAEPMEYERVSMGPTTPRVTKETAVDRTDNNPPPPREG